jgi:acyl-coenzyme A synthetase/AMP-(fatty) acid ligase
LHSSPATDQAAIENFDWLLRSPVELPPLDRWRYATFEMMLKESDPEKDRRPLLIGANQAGPLELTLADLRRAADRAEEWRQQQGLAPGDSLLLVRLPHSSEVPLAAAVIALMSLGLRVVLPMSFDSISLGEMAQATDCRAMLWCAGEVADSPHDAVRHADAMYREVAAEVGVPTFSIDGELDWNRSSAGDTEVGAATQDRKSDNNREVLVLSTSGSTGTPKLVRYTERALLAVAEAWNAAGLMSEELTGGRSICPTLSHSMGFRNVLHAIWNRQSTLLAQPEWLEEKPKQFVKLLEKVAPQHITCGPALLSDLSLLAANVRRFREALSSLRCVVSSGAADIERERILPESVRLANAFGMTETQQVLNTLIGPPPHVPGALGHPLPGVAVAVRYEDSSQQMGRLFVESPFGARGYLGAPDFGPWFDTGDLVRVAGDELVWIGRANEDFLNTGHGAKVSLVDLRNNYRQLQRESEAVLFVASPSRGGVAALVYVGGRDPADAEVHRQLLAAIAADHEKMSDERRDFALNYMAISAIGCVAGQPPKIGPGKIDGKTALADRAELLAALDDPVTNHAQVISVPQYGSDRPDWRRYT